MLQSKNKNQMEIWESALLSLCAAVTRVWSCFSIVLLPTGSSPFHHLIFLVTDIVFAKRKKKTNNIVVREQGLLQFFLQQCFQDLKYPGYRGPELLHEDRIDSVNQTENLLSDSQTFNLLLRIIRTPKSLCKPFLLDRYSHVLIFLLQK